MNLPILMPRQARREFDDAVDWYDERRAGLGPKFAAAVQDVLDEAAANPHRHPQVMDDVREGLVPDFPFCVYYRADAAHIEVIAVFHTSRDPAIWQARI